MKILKPKQVAELLNVTVKTLQNWDKDGILVAYRTPKNRRYYTLEQINNITRSTNSSGDVVIYARVSSRNQKEDLENQIEFLKNYCNSKGYNIERIITDIGSGLNYNRKNWNDLLTDILSIVIALLNSAKIKLTTSRLFDPIRDVVFYFTTKYLRFTRFTPSILAPHFIS